jgi:hypothetical protein
MPPPTITTPGLLLVLSVAVVGVLHTAVPDHWVPITLIARQRGWSKSETAKAAVLAGTGHVVTTLVIGLAVWFGGAVFATRFGDVVDTIASLALVLFGGWIAFSAWREIRGPGHGHGHGGLFGHSHDDDQGHDRDAAHMGRFDEHDHHTHEHNHGHSHDEDEAAHDPLYARLTGDVAVLTRHTHAHRHGGAAHVHWHDHAADTAHQITADMEAAPPLHVHKHRASGRTALLLILGSSPMVEGIPAFFAASRYGFGLISLMAVVFALSTIVTYVVLCVYSAAGLQRVNLGPLERYGEVISGAFIALVGVVFWLWPVV